MSVFGVVTENDKAGVVSDPCFITDETSEISEWKEGGVAFFFVLHATRDPLFLQIVVQFLHYRVDTSGSVQVLYGMLGQVGIHLLLQPGIPLGSPSSLNFAESSNILVRLSIFLKEHSQ